METAGVREAQDNKDASVVRLGKVEQLESNSDLDKLGFGALPLSTEPGSDSDPTAFKNATRPPASNPAVSPSYPPLPHYLSSSLPASWVSHSFPGLFL